MSNLVNYIPAGRSAITPSLICRNAARAIEFYKSVFGATEVMRMTGPDGKIGHAELKIGNSLFFVTDEFPGHTAAPSPASLPSASLFLYVEDVDTTFNHAVKAGSTVKMPVEDQFWGDRFGSVTDPFGHNWGLATHVEDVAPAELERRAKEWTEKMAKSAKAAAPAD
jgi:PhnB protein